MFRYVALAWNTDDRTQCAAAQLVGEKLLERAISLVESGRGPFDRTNEWGQVGAKSGLWVFHTTLRQQSLRACALARESGALLGVAFHRNRECTDVSPADRFTPTREQCEQIVATRGRWLIEHVWGNYVAVLRDPASRRSWVVKDPCGTLPCFRTSFRGVHVVFSDIAALLDTRLFAFTINSRYLANRVLHGEVVEDQALNEVERVHRGECVDLADASGMDKSGPRHREFFWHPLSFTDSNEVIEDSGYAARAMSATVRSCTHTYAREHQSALHRLSGGLDSSIVAACLADAPEKPELCCYTYFLAGGRSDERPWARLAASRCGLRHEEHAVTPSSIPLSSVLDAPPSVEPTAVLGYIHRSTLEQQIASAHRATAVFCGDGGDSGFCGDTCAYAVSEYLRRHGFGMQALHLAAKVAALTEESSWTVMLKSLRRWLRGAGMEHQLKMLSSASRLPSKELLASHSRATTFPHPWFSHLHPIPWALVRRLGALLTSPQFYNVVSGAQAPEVIAPLYSQPAMELFLRIPLDLHFHGGIERGLARHAFEKAVPPEIVRRRWKDRAPGFLELLVQRHRAFLRDMLLGGVLENEGLIDRSAVEDALADRISSSTAFPGELLRHLDAEIWARQWRSSALATGNRAIA